MQRLLNKVHRLLVCEDRPTAVEYPVMLALRIVVCLTVIPNIGARVNSTFTSVGGALPGGGGGSWAKGSCPWDSYVLSQLVFEDVSWCG